MNKDQQELAQAWFDNGETLFFSEEEEAIASYDKAIEIKPDYYEAWYWRGYLLDDLGRYEQALVSYDKAVEIKPDYYEAWSNRAILLGKLGRYEEAIVSCDKAVEIKPDDHDAWHWQCYHDAWYWRGYALDNLGRYEDAIASYDKALEIKPDDPFIWYNRGIALEDLGRTEEAIASYDKALEIKPDFLKAWFIRGIVLVNLGRTEEAIASYDKALEIKPDYHDAWCVRGLALDDLGRTEEAIASYDKALEIKPDYHDAWDSRGIALANLGRYEEAIASYNKALEIKPDDDDVWYNKACCCALQGNIELALENFQHAIQLNPDECRQMAKTDSDFDSIRGDSRFQMLIQDYEFGNVSNPEEAQRLGEILCQCFNFPTKDWPFYRDRLGLESFRVLRQEGQIAAGLGIYPMGQWFGGQSVPMAGIAAVGVPPEYRGTGVAFELLSQTLKELYERCVPLSSLYPATQRLYRKVGYEQAGIRCTWELPTQTIRMSERSLPVGSVESSQHEVFHKLYRQQAIRNNGNLDRNTAIWENVVLHPENAVYAYIAGSESQPEGYIIFSPKQEAGSNILSIWDWAAVTPAAQRRLWAFLADHRSQIDKIIWHGSSLDSRLFLLPEQTAKIRSSDIWFLRVVNAALALEKRGYPAGLVTELHLSVTDDLLPANNRNFILNVSGGRGEVTPGGNGEMQLDIRALAPLYTGLFTAYQLQATGQLEATENALSVATQIFAGAQPWMPDFF